MLEILPITLRFLLGSFLWPKDPVSSPLTLTLRHEHAVSHSTRIIFSDTPPTTSFIEPYAFDTVPVRIHRPVSASAFQSARMRSMRYAQNEKVLWDDIEVKGPNVEDRETLLTLAKMTSNAYAESHEQEWYAQDGWNTSVPFGYEPDADGFRGHVFVSDDNSTVVISIKGTSAGWLVGSGGPTIVKDKLNDNILFSCCCARVGPTWSTVCGCFAGGYKCDQACVEDAMTDESLFYSVGMNLYNNVTYMYPNANIWIVGHSLGGAVASLLGVTFGVPVVAFEAPGEKLAASRLHLPSPPSTHHVTHIYHTADPIAMGTCTGVTSVCGIAGYAMESRCHLGKIAKYDTVGKLGWSVDSRKHPIKVVIEQLLSEDWPVDDDSTPGIGQVTGRQKTRTVPLLVEEKDCTDCFNWEFGDYNKTK